MVNLAEQYLSREVLTLKVIVNLARRRPPKEALPDSGVWRARYDHLLDSLLAARFPLPLMPERRFSPVALNDLWRKFARMRVDDPQWDWLIKFCRRWAKVRGVDLPGAFGSKDSQSRGGSGRAPDKGLLLAIEVVLEQKGVKPTEAGVVNWLKANYSHTQPFETGVPDCDELHITEDRCRITWVRSDGSGDERSVRSIDRYIEKVLATK